MRFTQWMAQPHLGPPPFGHSPAPHQSNDPFPNYSWDVALLPATGLGDDIEAAGITFTPGRGNTYRRGGRPVTPDAAAVAIADILAVGAENMSIFLSDSLAVEIIRDADAHLIGLAPHSAAANALRLERQHAAGTLPMPLRDLELYELGARDTARAIRRWPSVRTLTLRTFRPVIRAYRVTAADELASLFDTLPAGFIARADLFAQVPESTRKRLGKTAVYAAAEAQFGPAVRRHPGRFGFVVV
ncbi:hypothetical protein ACFOYW_13400 [Gryllotalpicola reticulitermitis]|uniref:Uncharacterized protein n=1 Tax=Gryllotalpicola reticulitermitis TaxID=1184153 RepID=A0ABV8QA49_9MICO